MAGTISLKEVLLRERRRERLVKLYRRGELPFSQRDNGEACSHCQSSTHPGRVVELLEIEDHDGTILLLCRGCFLAYFDISRHGGLWSGFYGSPRPSTPRSEATYEGPKENFL